MGEIAQLKLDADWVVLSACNTAASDCSPGAEGLSGLARAFFFAGSRALLVSQWEVLSVAAVQLTTGTVERLAARPADRSCCRLAPSSMLALLAEDQPDYLARILSSGRRLNWWARAGPRSRKSARPAVAPASHRGRVVYRNVAACRVIGADEMQIMPMRRW